MEREPCPGEEALLALLDDPSGEASAAARAHLGTCAACRRLVAVLVRTRDADAPPSSAPAEEDRGREPAPEAAAPGRGPEPAALRATDPAAISDEEWTPPRSFDDYEVLAPLGQGQMGQVFSARDVQLDRPVAIKFLRDRAARGQGFERLRNEARAIARLRHPGVVQVHRFGEVQGRPYLVTELLEGESLDRLLRREGRLPWRRVLDLGLRLCDALGAAHAEGVLHRDIKPANVFLMGRGEPKLLDFGLAKLIAAEEAPRPARFEGSPSLTQTGALLGTPLYMAPELWRGEAATLQSDIYALGGMLFELCAGRSPHRAASLVELADAVMGTDAPPLRQVAPDVDEGLAAIVDRCLRRDPAARFPTAAAVLDALRRRERELLGRRRRGALMILGAAACLSLPVLWVVAPRGRPALGALVELPGGELPMGSTPAEAQAALEACRRVSDKPQEDCREDLFQREVPSRRVRVAPFSIHATEVTLGELATWLQGLADRGALTARPDDRLGEPRWVLQDGALLADMHFSYKPVFGMRLEVERDKLRFSVVPEHERRPATHVTWTAAARYCRDHGLRLPTEAEWEHAARGAAGRRFPWGFDEPLCDRVVFDRVKGGKCEALGAELAPVATSPQDVTPEGIFDLGGNVGEWVLDRFTAPYAPCPAGGCVDPLEGPADPGARPATPPALRVNRGGRLQLDWTASRGASRIRYPEDQAFTDIGFRCVKPRP